MTANMAGALEHVVWSELNRADRRGKTRRVTLQWTRFFAMHGADSQVNETDPGDFFKIENQRNRLLTWKQVKHSDEGVDVNRV